LPHTPLGELAYSSFYICTRFGGGAARKKRGTREEGKEKGGEKEGVREGAIPLF